MRIIKKRVHYKGYKHIRSYEPDDVLALVSIRGKTRKWMIDGVKHRIRFRSQRLQCFKRSKVCAECGLVGTVMSLDKSKSGLKQATAHFNLYAEIGKKFRLMTKDHIIPRSKGGKDHLDNLQTMCDKCNGKKGDKLLVEELLNEDTLSIPPMGPCASHTVKNVIIDIGE